MAPGGSASMARKYFGTDGVRGFVGEAPITPEFVMKLGYAAGSEKHRDCMVSMFNADSIRNAQQSLGGGLLRRRW